MLTGFKKLSQDSGCAFEVTPAMVGLNRESVVKVWFNSNYGRTEP